MAERRANTLKAMADIFESFENVSTEEEADDAIENAQEALETIAATGLPKEED